MQDEYQATVLEELFVQLEVTGWQRNAALEPPVGDLQAVDRGAMESWRQRALTSLIWKSVPLCSAMSSVAADMIFSRVAALLRVLAPLLRRVAPRARF